MTTDWRALCVELVDELEGWIAYGDEIDIANAHVLIDRTRAALAEPEPEGPTDEELIQQAIKTGLAVQPHPKVAEVYLPFDGEEWPIDDELIIYARAVLARWGNPAPVPPADGQVAELVAALRNDAINCTCSTLTSGDLRRAADLIEQRQSAPVPVPDGGVGDLVAWADEARYFAKELRDQADDLSPSLELFGLIHRAADLLEQRQAAPVPVPVSERLPGPEDCDEDGRCWWYGDGEDMVGWTFQDLEGLSYYKATHWLPASALPIPTTEAQP